MSKRVYDSIASEDISCGARVSPFDSEDDVFNRVNHQMVNSLQAISLPETHTKDISQMFLNQRLSDCVLRVQGVDIPVNRSVLSARCPHFMALFFGSMAESGKSVIELFGVKVEPFKHVLQFIYSGSLSLNSLSLEMIIEVLSHSQYYCLQELVDKIVDYLKISLSTSNVFIVQKAANLYSIPDLIRTINLFIDQNAEEIIKSESFLCLSSEQLIEMFKRDSFYVENEETILQNVLVWIQQNTEQINGQTLEDIFDSIRLWEINKEIAKYLIESNPEIGSDVTQMIEKKLKRKPKLNDRKSRGFVVLNQNVASNRFDVRVMKGRQRNRMINDSNRWYSRTTCTSHTIGNSANCVIMVQLSKVFLVNHIFLVLYDVGIRTYSYVIEVSVDRKTWHKVVDHQSFLCRSNQYLFFEPRPVKYIRIQGTDSMTLFPLVRYLEFNVLHFECMYSTVCPQMQMQFIKPKHNVFNNGFYPKPINEKRYLDLKQNYEIKEELEGSVIKRESIPFQKGSYFWFVANCAYVHFSQPFIINTIIVELDRTKEYIHSFSFCIEVSLNNILWKRICDKRDIKDGFNRVVFQFDEEVVLFVRINSSDVWSTDNLKSIECLHCDSKDMPIVSKKVKH